MLESMLNALAAKGAYRSRSDLPSLSRHPSWVVQTSSTTGPIARQARYIALRGRALRQPGSEVAGKPLLCRLVTLVEENGCIPEPV